MVLCRVLVQVGPDLVVQGLNATADSFYSSQVRRLAVWPLQGHRPGSTAAHSRLVRLTPLAGAADCLRCPHGQLTLASARDKCHVEQHQRVG